MEKVTPFLWFNDNAEEAVDYYLGIFPESVITGVTRYAKGMPMPEGAVATIAFTLNGQALIALNGGPAFQFNEAVSFLVRCEDQQEIDHYWDRLVEDGTPMACGWLKDKYGLAWQIVPARFFEMISSEDGEQVGRVMAAMNTMVKFDVAGLEAAYGAD